MISRCFSLVLSSRLLIDKHAASALSGPSRVFCDLRVARSPHNGREGCH